MRSLLAATLILATATAAHAQTPQEYTGTIGQQTVRLTLRATAEAITAASYRYSSNATDVPISESKLIGSTVILADDDGNIFHLHLKAANGTGTSDVLKAAELSGVMDRDTLELPVKLSRKN